MLSQLHFRSFKLSHLRFPLSLCFNFILSQPYLIVYSDLVSLDRIGLDLNLVD